MSDWLNIAKNLPCGRSVRVSCCAKDKSCVISHSEHGYSSYCFRCGEDSRRFKRHGQRSLAELLQHRKELNSYMEARGALQLPDDFTLDLPKRSLPWLLTAGVSTLVARYYGFGWSPKLERVVLPVYDAGELVAVQSRAIHPDQKPKYLNKSGGSVRSPVFRSDETLRFEHGLSDGVIITEDILSCVRTGRLVPSISTLGTNVSDKLASELQEDNVSQVFIWYDGDEAGIRGSRKAKKSLDLLGVPNTIIKTDKDPKEYNNEEIREIVRSAGYRGETR